MRQNNHIVNRHTYQNASSFKIRQPMNQRSYQFRQNIPLKQRSKQTIREYNCNLPRGHKQTYVSSFYQKNPYWNHAQYESRQNSQQLSYNSRGSNATKNSLKMTDYIALQAKHLIQNRDKYKYDNQQQNHIRSSSMHCYSSNFKVKKGNNQNCYNYPNTKQIHNQPTQIPSFGIQCRTTISAGYNASQKSHSLSKYPTNSYKLQDPSISYRLQNRSIKTQIDQRIQKLKTSSTSAKHKQRLSNIKKFDDNRIENMDKINIKIKKILTTLQQQEDHYKKKFVQGQSNRVKTQSSAFYNAISRQLEEQQEQSLLSKYTNSHDTSQKRQSLFNMSHHQIQNKSFSGIYQENSSIADNTALEKYCDNNVLSYYYYEDESAMIKSSQSPFKSTPQRSFKKYSVEKQKNVKRSAAKYSKGSIEIANSKAIGMNDLRKPWTLLQRKQNSWKVSQQKNYRGNCNLLTNIPECETQIIQSKAFQSKSNAFVNAYHTFDSRNSQLNRDSRAQNYKNKNSPEQLKLTNWSQEQQNYQTPQLHQLQKYHDYYLPGNKNTFNTKQVDSQRSINPKNSRNQNKQAQVNYREQEYGSNNRKTHMIYFKLNDQDKYLKSTERDQKLKQTLNSQNQNFINKVTTLSLNSQASNQFNPHHILPQKYTNNRNSPYLQTFNHRNHVHQLTFDQRKKNFIYSDSIKQTPRIEEVTPNQNQSKFFRNSAHYTRDNHFKTNFDQNLDFKLKEYQKRLQKYQEGMSVSKILESQRSENKSLNTKREKSFSIHNSQDKYSNQSKSYRTNSGFKPIESVSNFSKDNPVSLSEKNMERMLSELRKERLNRQRQDEKKNSKSVSKSFYDLRPNNQSRDHLQQKSIRLISLPTKNQQHRSHRLPKQDHEKFIQNLRRDRQEVAQLSQRKSRNNNGLSAENSRLQASNERSESQNSKLSSNTIVKGKNIDEEINKIQKKMQEYNQMKKELNLDSQQNTQRSTDKYINNERNDNESQGKKISFGSRSPRRQKSVRFQDRQSYSQIKRGDLKTPSKKSCELLKIVTQQNSFVKVRNSILKEHKINEIKNYLDDQIQRESNCSKSIEQRNQVPSTKSHNKLNKQNVLPPTTTTIDSPKYPNGSKKVVLGLAQNLVLNQNSHDNVVREEKVAIKAQINTPKLLRNLKNKLKDKCIVKKKTQKRNFRSQFINDLHSDNQLLTSAKKIQQQNEPQDIIESTSRYSPQNKQTLIQILHLLEQQILIDQKLRNEKKMFNAMTKKDKWSFLMAEYIKQSPNEAKILLSQIVQMFTLSEEESNPFYSTRGVQFSLESMVRTYTECRKHWDSLVNKLSSFSLQQVRGCGLNGKSLDIDRKGFIEVDDLTRLMNMELNKYYRKRDLWLIWQRIAKANIFKNEQTSEVRLNFEQLSRGLGLVQ